MSPGVSSTIHSWRKGNGKQKAKAFKTREFPNSNSIYLWVWHYNWFTENCRIYTFILQKSALSPWTRLRSGGKRAKKNWREPKKSASEASWTAAVSLRFLPFSPPSPVTGYLDLKACERWYFSFCLTESSQYSFPREHDGVFPCLSFILWPVCTYSHLRDVLRFSVLRFLVIDSSHFSFVMAYTVGQFSRRSF